MRSFCLVSSNGWSVLYLASSKSRTHYSIALKFSAVQLKWTLIKTVSAFKNRREIRSAAVTNGSHTTWKVSLFGVFLVRIFLHSDWIWRDTEYLSAFSPHSGEYGPEKLRIRKFFRQCYLLRLLHTLLLCTASVNEEVW